MLPFVLAVLLLPGLILANTQCPSGDISCPEGKTCCTVDGKPSCCDEDPEGQLPFQAAILYSNSTNITIQNSMWDNNGCTMFNCAGTCCNSGNYGCCPIKMATCCPGDKCCDFGSTCCSGGCCGFMSRCCGTWCCKSSQRCGRGYRTCYNAAATMAPTAAVVSMMVLWLAVKMVSQM